ncbi:MAG: signal peptidase I [Firmicutes bacterium]|nr:signal peptidase I [Bacillota bacterium]
MKENIKKIIAISVLSIITIPILFVALVILIDFWTNPDENPSFFSWKPFVVLSDNVETEVYSGDIIIVQEIDTKELKENDIIAFKLGNTVVAKRIVEIKNESQLTYITQGDSNKDVDAWYVFEEDIEGIYRYRIPKLGNLAILLQTPIGMIMFLSIPIILLAIILFLNKKKKQQTSKKELEQ